MRVASGFPSPSKLGGGGGRGGLFSHPAARVPRESCADLLPPLKSRTMESKPLVVSKQKTEVVCGVPTQVVCTAFSSHILVVVTQFGKMGTLVSLEPSNVANDISKPVLTTKVLLGQDEPLIHVFAKNLVSFVSQEAGNRAVLLAMAVKDKSMEGLKALKEVIRVCQVW
ncbi:proteasome assembly chaperone 3 isoform X1 [Octodon degus]|uniref:Proteasome assembly chaperone 3 isoform X1 n=2 Tax=Octodon degus TaxID=10160 RepID=A0A6P6EA89_OCTDE|nr:proteasome assembly chaperone 3 isoform X1 [Octodon degus]